jgi:hypothetical protein
VTAEVSHHALEVVGEEYVAEVIAQIGHNNSAPSPPWHRGRVDDPAGDTAAGSPKIEASGHNDAAKPE